MNDINDITQTFTYTNKRFIKNIIICMDTGGNKSREEQYYGTDVLILRSPGRFLKK